MTISERISYIKGLTEGLELDTTTKEGMVLNAIIYLLEDLVYEIDAIDEACAEIGEQLDAVDEDLALIEDEFYADDEDYEDEEDEDEYYDDEDVYEVQCPNCNDIIYLDESMLEEEEMICPNCGTRLEFEFECECSCGCGDDCDCPPDCECGCNSDK
ncbi:MAG: hypothetical protein IIX54_01135 [Clostridia bacterium]|nr:hypothetical protein [Clostridia bacterium]